MLRQHHVARCRGFQNIKEARKVFRHLEQADGVAHGGRIDHNVIEVAIDQVVDREQGRDLGHAGQAGIEQRLQLLPRKQTAFAKKREDLFALGFQKAFDLLLRIDLAHPEMGRR